MKTTSLINLFQREMNWCLRGKNMSLIKYRFKNIEELKKHILSDIPTFYFSSATSTVIPYDKLEELYKEKDFHMADLSGLPAAMKITDEGNLIVRGPVNWEEAKIFLKQYNRTIKTAPTESLALITAGAATSATGERCFHFGTLRSQIKRMKYLDQNANEIELHSKNDFPQDFNKIKEYQKEYKDYLDFKNAPFPRFEKETDLLVGTEGQLGVITEIEIETCENKPVNHLFMLLPKWEEDDSLHLEIIKKIQNYRDQVILCEFIDSNSFTYLPEEERPNQNMDTLFFEIFTDQFEAFYEHFVLSLENLNQDLVFEISETKFHQTRASIPRAVFETNSRMGVVKKGTDVQLRIEQFENLLSIYRKFSKKNIRYNLFGHFGDAHLHFNFMPTPEQTQDCQEELENMYKLVKELKGSPFAEHGIGIIKQKFIKEYWPPSVKDLFKELKIRYDSKNKFFPQGFMSID